MISQAFEKFKEQVKGHNLFAFHGPYSLMLAGIPWAHVSEGPVYIPMPLFFINKDRDTQAIVSEDTYKGHAKEVFKMYIEGRLDLNLLQTLFDKTYNESKQLYDNISDSDIKTWSDSEIDMQMGKACEYLWHLLGRTLYMETFDKQIADSVVTGKDREDLDNIWDKAVHPKFESFEIRRKKQTQEIINKYGVGALAVRKAAFLYVDYFLPKSKEEVKKLLTSFVEEAEQQEKNNDAQLQLSDNERKLFDYVQFVMKMRDIRKDPIAWLQAVIGELASEMVERAGIDVGLITTMSPLEYRKGIEWLKDNKDILIQGKNGVALYIQDDGQIVKDYISPIELKDSINDLLGLSKEVSEIKGQPASKGSWKGKVRIVIDSESPEAHAFQDGDVLVTSMTRPEFVPLMKKAGAVITNEGGITCHAAIVSRELGIPCVIGTKIATKVLKDGDIVEVDAGKGIIRIIK